MRDICVTADKQRQELWNGLHNVHFGMNLNGSHMLKSLTSKAHNTQVRYSKLKNLTPMRDQEFSGVSMPVQ